MVYAQIRDDSIKNTIVVDEETPLELFSAGFDYLIRIDNLDVIPGINWSYDGANFSPPIQSEGEQ